MKTFGNILWLIFGGLFGALGCFIEGVLCCITLIFIPIGLQYFKLAKFFLWPMGKTVVNVSPSGFKTVVNILWAIFGGWWHCLCYYLVGLIFCITIIGIPFGKQYFKLGQFILTPLGHDFAVATAPVEAESK